MSGILCLLFTQDGFVCEFGSTLQGIQHLVVALGKTHWPLVAHRRMITTLAKKHTDAAALFVLDVLCWVASCSYRACLFGRFSCRDQVKPSPNIAEPQVHMINEQILVVGMMCNVKFGLALCLWNWYTTGCRGNEKGPSG